MKPRLLGALYTLLFTVSTGAAAALVPYDFNFSTAGTGTFEYDTVTMEATQIVLDFGPFGNSGPSSFSQSLTVSVFGAPPNPFVNNDNTFFGLSGGSAYGIRLNTDGTFCVRPDADICGGAALDIAIGSYLISSVPVPAALWLFSSGLLGLIGLAKRKKAV
jgi:hypothetical protein